ncbi:hypothetical protein [Paraflavitalea speifideaquila]|uniref:hypothetical protein n=1 Tax=Paraflavitalea speifideaquila TaxID=3076558 RepID=UPI0028EC3984|nr:hypothetical protein [Paraflavitalea speifideiaquila]
MARYLSNIEIHGSVGEQTFYTNAYGKQVKAKGSPNAHAMKHGDNFLNSRCNAAEFKRATGAGKLFRLAMGPVLAGVKNMQLSGRMIGWLHPVIKGYRMHNRGERTMKAGDFSRLGDLNLTRTMGWMMCCPSILPTTAGWKGEQQRWQSLHSGYGRRKAYRQGQHITGWYRVYLGSILSREVYT